MDRLQTQLDATLYWKPKIHKVTEVVPAAGHERGDIEVTNYVVLPRGQDNCLPPRPLILDVTV